MAGGRAPFFLHGSFLPPLNIHFLLFFCLSLVPGTLALCHLPLVPESRAAPEGSPPLDTCTGQSGPSPHHHRAMRFPLEPAPGTSSPWVPGGCPEVQSSLPLQKAGQVPTPGPMLALPGCPPHSPGCAPSSSPSCPSVCPLPFCLTSAQAPQVFRSSLSSEEMDLDHVAQDLFFFGRSLSHGSPF